MASVFDPFIIKDLEIKNRIVMAPMCMYMATDGYADDWHMIHYATRAMGGVGLIMVEATAVSPEGRISPDDLGIWHDDYVAGLRRIVDRVHSCGSRIGIQLAHAGRKACLPGERILAPTELPFSSDYAVPAAMSTEEIARTVKAFGEAARRALAAGFDTVEIHGAHGYLINQFISPLTNHRQDAYGGSLEARSRFLREVLTAVREEWPASKPLLLRISAAEYDSSGNTTEEIAEIVNRVKSAGLDIVHVSSGGLTPEPVNAYPGYQLELGRQIRSLCGLPAIVGGMVTETQMVEEILGNQRGDLVFLGRELLRNPYWVLQASQSLGSDMQWPKPYERGKRVRKG